MNKKENIPRGMLSIELIFVFNCTGIPASIEFKTVQPVIVIKIQTQSAIRLATEQTSGIRIRNKQTVILFKVHNRSAEK